MTKRDTTPARLRLAAIVILLLLVNWVAAALLTGPRPHTTVSYTFFVTQVQRSNVAEITATGDTIEGTFLAEVDYTPYDSTSTEKVTRFTAQRPDFADDNLFALLQGNGVYVNAGPPAPPSWQRLLIGLGPALLLSLLLIWWTRRRTEGRAPTLADVGGIDSVAGEVDEVVGFLRDPARCRKLGARIPAGVLLDGPPGTGKTLLARAIAGEADVSVVDSGDVADLFARARRAAPAVVLIDRLDAIGDTPERVRRLVAEMDGLTGDEGVIVVATTDRAEGLDPALLRAGRFGRRITMVAPDRGGRWQILALHTRGVPVDPAADLDALADDTAGMVGADLRDLVNEAALLAARRRHETVTAEDFGDALRRKRVG